MTGGDHAPAVGPNVVLLTSERNVPIRGLRHTSNASRRALPVRVTGEVRSAGRSSKRVRPSRTKVTEIVSRRGLYRSVRKTRRS